MYSCFHKFFNHRYYQTFTLMNISQLRTPDFPWCSYLWSPTVKANNWTNKCTTDHQRLWSETLTADNTLNGTMWPSPWTWYSLQSTSHIHTQSILPHAGKKWIWMLWDEKRRKWKSRQSPGVKPCLTLEIHLFPTRGKMPWAFRVRKPLSMGSFLTERIFQSRVLTAHTEWLPGVQLRHSVPAVQFI